MIEGAKFRTKKDVTINVPLGIEESRKIYLVLKLLACFLLVILALLNDAFLWRMICIVGMGAVIFAPLHKYISTFSEFTTPLSVALVESKPMLGRSSHGRIVVEGEERRAWVADLEVGYLELPKSLYDDLDQSCENDQTVQLLVGYTPDRKYVWARTYSFPLTKEDFEMLVDEFVNDIESRAEYIYTNFDNWHEQQEEPY